MKKFSKILILFVPLVLAISLYQANNKFDKEKSNSEDNSDIIAAGSRVSIDYNHDDYYSTTIMKICVNPDALFKGNEQKQVTIVNVTCKGKDKTYQMNGFIKKTEPFWEKTCGEVNVSSWPGGQYTCVITSTNEGGNIVDSDTRYVMIERGYVLDGNGGIVYSTVEKTKLTSTWSDIGVISESGYLQAELNKYTAVEKTGYTFTGWGTTSSCTSGVKTKTNLLGAGQKYYACWTKNLITVTYKNTNTLAGTIGTSASTCTRDSNNGCEVTLPKPTPKTDYSFRGWSLNSDCANINIAVGVTKNYITTDKTFYACWKLTNTPETKTTTPSTKTVETEKPTTKSINGIRYAKASGSQYSGNSINCGDALYITTCTTEGICTVTKINGTTLNNTTTIKDSNLVEKFENAKCDNIIRYIRTDGFMYTNKELTAGKTNIDCGTKVDFGSEHEINYWCTEKWCNAIVNGKNVYIPRDLFTSSAPLCSAKCESSKPIKDGTGKYEVRICYKYDNNEYIEQDQKLDDAVTCNEEFTKEKLAIKENTCTEEKSCYQVYEVKCKYLKRPSLSGTGSVVRTDGYGTLTFTAKDNGNYGIRGYYVSNGDVPTINSPGWYKFNDSKSLTETLNKQAGTYYIWTMNGEDRISLPIILSIYDTDTTTTADEIGIKGEDGFNTVLNQTETNDSIALGGVTSSKFALLSNNLKDDSTLAQGFDKFKTGYELTVKSDKVAIYATLTSKDSSFVDGYEPRTINLEYGRNVALIKIKNKKGKERTYTFIITREDDRANDNLIKSVKLSNGEINFDSHVSDYTVNVGSNVKSVNINATLANTTASFVKGYEPRMIALNNDTTSAVLRVISESGSVRSYVFTFVKGNFEDNDVENSVYLDSLSIPGTEINFDKKTTGYNASVEYEVDSIPVYAFAESSKAKVSVEGNLKLKVGTNPVQITVTNGSKTKVYTIHVIRKEAGLGVTNDTTLRNLSVAGYDIGFDRDIFDYTLKIKREKTLQIVAEPNSNRSEVYMYGNNDLTGFSSVRVKVIAENGKTGLYSIDIQKDAYNKKLEVTAAIVGCLIIVGGAIIIIIKKKVSRKKDYNSAE